MKITVLVLKNAAVGPFLAFTAFFVHYMTTRLVEIAEILEPHGIFGGGVYPFSYLVLGPVVSFVAVSSIMFDYVLTAGVSAVDSEENATSFFSMQLTGVFPPMQFTIDYPARPFLAESLQK